MKRKAKEGRRTVVEGEGKEVVVWNAAALSLS